MKNITIKTKLILLFILIKVIPLLLISYIAYKGALKLEEYLQDSTRYLANQNKEIILNTADLSINDSIENLDKKSQLALERLSFEIANKVAEFLYERDKDILFLSNLEPTQKTLESFYKNKIKDILVHEDYIYDENTHTWKSSNKPQKFTKEDTKATLKDNEKEFNYTNPLNLEKKSIPIYKEISFFDTKGIEKIKVSQINKELLDISKKSNTYINSEDYFNSIQKLKKGEIYVSEVIGEQLKTKVIGTFTKEKAKKSKIDFEPQKYAYAGKENPLGKEFEGIIRFITPVFNNHKKIGYISLALDHKHIMQFTDTVNPTSSEPIQNISDASVGNYAFMWSAKGKNISHPRDYFISGYDKTTGKPSMPWLSKDVASKFNESNKEINEFLKDYPIFEEQSLKKKPNITQLIKDGQIGLDCRYLNFAPQCEGWMQVTKDGGYGSFIIYWSKVWKLTTAATIPYYTGQYASTKRGFGFITIGANVEEFHSAANKTKENIKEILKNQTAQMEELVDENKLEVKSYIDSLISELSVATLLMIVLIIAIALWMSNYITSKIKNLLEGTKKFANNELDYKIKVTSKDEIGNLEKSFNNMAIKMKNLMDEQNKLNSHLEDEVNKKTKELQNINKDLEIQIEDRTRNLKEALINAQKADEAKSVFLANISHEIRTPLNAIIGFSDILYYNNTLDVTSKKQAKIIQSSANSLLSIINDILDISKIENGNFDINIEKTDLHFICEHVTELFSKKAIEKNIKLVFNFDYNIPKCLLTDGIRIRQVLSNLLSNAIKFTPSHGLIELNITLIGTKNNKATLSFEVSDTGIGIPPEKINYIFRPFIQVDHKSNREYEGTGLGLSISSHIVESLGSKINIESSVGSGSKFHFNLTFDISESMMISDNNYINHLNFKITDSNSDLYSYIKKYLDIFGTVENKESKDEIIIYTKHSKENLENLRKTHPNKPVLILFDYEDDIKKINFLENELPLALPFYASKVNDILQELKQKNLNNIPRKEIKDETTFNGNILVAEDNLANQELMSYILNSFNLEFDIASNGQEAYELSKNNPYDLILMDINMPILDGIKSFNKIRKHEEENNVKQTPIIALTANAIKGDKEKFLNLGMNDYLSKPINTDELKIIFNKYLNNKIVEIQEKEETKIENNSLDTPITFEINVEKIVKKLGVSENIVLMIVKKFRKSIELDLKELEQLINNNNIDEIKNKAHYIKNSCLNVAIDEACEILQKLEDTTLSKEERIKLYNNLDSGFKEILES